ncbi:hypothetical protein PG996_007028 [Apiospora saccharicola]|uniref:Uncharacterized protein n=1 Tax=Apiospora saccharicola TaxID=335842 RepID=A0ABR1V9P0_9PEZI
MTETVTPTDSEPEFTAVLNMEQKRTHGLESTSSTTSTSSGDDFIIYGRDLPTHSELWSVPTITMRRSRTLTVPLSLETGDGLELPNKKRMVDISSLTIDLALPTVTDDILPSVTLTDDLPLETDDLDLDPDLGFMHKRAMVLPSVTTDDLALPTETDDLLPSLTLTDDIPVETDDLDLGLMKRSMVVPSVTDDLDLPTMTASFMPSLTLTDDLPLETDDLGLDLMNKRAAVSVTDMLLPTETDDLALPSLTISSMDLPLETDDLDGLLDDIIEKRNMMNHRPSHTVSSDILPSLTVSSLLDLPQQTDDLELPLDIDEKRDMMKHRPTHSLSRFPVVVPSATRLFPSSSDVLPLPLETAAAVDPDLDFAMHKSKRQEEEAVAGEDDKRIKPTKLFPSLPTASTSVSVSGLVLPKPSVTAPPQVHDHCGDCGAKCVAAKDVEGILKCVEDCVAHCLSHLPVQTGSVVVNSLSMSQ